MLACRQPSLAHVGCAARSCRRRAVALASDKGPPGALSESPSPDAASSDASSGRGSFWDDDGVDSTSVQYSPWKEGAPPPPLPARGAAAAARRCDRVSARRRRCAVNSFGYLSHLRDDSARSRSQRRRRVRCARRRSSGHLRVQGDEAARSSRIPSPVCGSLTTLRRPA